MGEVHFRKNKRRNKENEENMKISAKDFKEYGFSFDP